jgi:predicted DNA binding CopG/RHH family protein
MKKKIPSFKSDAEAEHFVDTADLSEYDLAGFKPFTFEFTRKSAQLNMRIPVDLLAAVKAHARKRGMPYTRLIRETLEQSLAKATARQKAKPRTRRRGGAVK